MGTVTEGIAEAAVKTAEVAQQADGVAQTLSMKGFSSYIKGFVGDHAGITQLFIIVLAVVIINFIAVKFLAKLEKQLEKTKNPWDDALISAIAKPLNWFIWLIGITIAIDVIQGSTRPIAIFENIDTIRLVGIIIIITWFLIRLVKGIERNLIDHKTEYSQKLDVSTIDALGKLVRLAIIITSVLVTLQTLGISVSGILAFGGIGGIAVGFAAKDLLANFFGGLMIYLDRPFSIGDWIRSPDKNIEGTVEHIGWRLTRIRTFDKRPLYVPNGIFTSISVENPSRMTNRRIKETMGIRYDDASKMAKIIEDVKEMLRNHTEIDQRQTMIVNFSAFAPSSLDFFIYTFTKTTNWIEYHKIKQDVLLKVVEIVEGNDAEFAFPTSTLHIASGDETEITGQ